MVIAIDAVLILIILAAVLRGYHTGAVGMVLLLLGWVTSAVLIVTISRPLSEGIYDTVVGPWVVQSVEKAVPADMENVMTLGADAMDSVQEILDALEGVLGGQIVDRTSFDAIREAMRSGSADIAGGISQSVFRPLFTGILRAAISFLILAVTLALFRGAANFVFRRARGILGRSNRLIGGAIGIAAGIAAGYIYAVALYAAVKSLDLAWLTPRMVEETRFVSQYLR